MALSPVSGCPPPPRQGPVPVRRCYTKPDSPADKALTPDAAAVTAPYPSTVIVRHPKESPRKCSVLPLRGRGDVVFLSYPVRQRPPLARYVRLAAEGPELSAADAAAGVLLL